MPCRRARRGGQILVRAVGAGALAFAAMAFTLPPPVLPTPAGLAIPAPPLLTLETAADQADRMTVPVMVDGKGPFPFVVDTGADRTVISSELAAALKLPPGPQVLVHGTGGADLEPTARIAHLAVGGRSMTDVVAPMLSALNLGAMGMLGIDVLRDQRMVIDFDRRTLTIEPSMKEKRQSGVVVVRAQSRYGELILVDAAIDNEPIAVILDTGAQNTIGNSALQRVVGHIGMSPMRLAGDVISVTGRTTPAYFSDLPQVEIGGIELDHQPVAFADLQTFAQFDLSRHPAMLLGMDTLRVFRRVVVDFGRKEVSFKLGPPPPPPGAGSLVVVADAR